MAGREQGGGSAESAAQLRMFQARVSRESAESQPRSTVLSVLTMNEKVHVFDWLICETKRMPSALCACRNHDSVYLEDVQSFFFHNFWGCPVWLWRAISATQFDPCVIFFPFQISVYFPECCLNCAAKSSSHCLNIFGCPQFKSTFNHTSGKSKKKKNQMQKTNKALKLYFICLW